jgi:hypothetical protein
MCLRAVPGSILDSQFFQLLYDFYSRIRLLHEAIHQLSETRYVCLGCWDEVFNFIRADVITEERPVALPSSLSLSSVFLSLPTGGILLPPPIVVGWGCPGGTGLVATDRHTGGVGSRLMHSSSLYLKI